MTPRFAAFAALLVASFFTSSTISAQQSSARSVRVRLPAPDLTFAGGRDAEPARRHCLTCHSSDYVYTQPPLTKAQWTAEVVKMIKVYGADISDSEIDRIVDYLVTQNGKP